MTKVSNVTFPLSDLITSLPDYEVVCVILVVFMVRFEDWLEKRELVKLIEVMVLPMIVN